MAEHSVHPSLLLIRYTVDVHLREPVADDELDDVIERVDDALYDGLFRLAQQLEEQFGVMVVAVDEDGGRWLSGGIASGATPAAGEVRLPEASEPGIVDA